MDFIHTVTDMTSKFYMSYGNLSFILLYSIKGGNLVCVQLLLHPYMDIVHAHTQ